MNTFIHTATISHKHGINLYHAKSKKGLRNQIYAFVCDYWKYELGDVTMPKSRIEAINQYFESCANRGEFVEYFEPVNLKSIPA